MDVKEKYEEAISNLYGGLSLSAQSPVIGISGNFVRGDCRLAEGYFMSVVKAGGSPIIIPPYMEPQALVTLLDTLDGIVLSGGADIDPVLLGEEPLECVSINERRDIPELLLIRLAVDRQIPMLGICRGIQMISAALGGGLYQDILSQHKGLCVCHNQTEPRHEASHPVLIEKGTLLHALFGKDRLMVNSFHHQAVKSVPQGFRVAALSEDGVIEAMESTTFKSILGVQWHPECMILNDDLSMMPVFDWLVAESLSFKKAKRLHKEILTLDSHCDTPMFFDCGAKFGVRNPQVSVRYDYVGETSPDGSESFLYDPLVNLHKMREGHLDANFMVAYLRQEGRSGPELTAATAKADRLLDLIEERICELPQYAKIARTPQELYDLKREGKKGVVLGIENGYALGLDIKNVSRFRNRGVAYMTLCHNGDNDVCDSARGNAEHGGLSQFGKQVVAEMNRVGMMIDLSHGAESSFYQAMELSCKPIICSHSSARALCDHPRDLTDAQLLALAETGGVAQVCMYSGFLRKDAPATIEDAVAHIMHIIEVAGIDHVGIGTDMDGGGGLIGLEDASTLINLTRRLVAQGLSHADLEKVWGGNFIRVWREVSGNL